jgi:hypothetical protein
MITSYPPLYPLLGEIEVNYNKFLIVLLVIETNAYPFYFDLIRKLYIPVLIPGILKVKTVLVILFK